MTASRSIYLDFNATTPLDPEVVGTMTSLLRTTFGNPSSAHAPGRAARRSLDDSRETLAGLLGADPAEIVFTGGGSEADSIAILGSAAARGRAGNVITVTTEHPAVLDACRMLRARGHRVTQLPVDRHGFVSVDAFERALRPDTFLATVMLANNETGTIQPVAELARIARARGVLMHTDAVQAFGKIPVRVGDLGVDLLSIAAHKFHGPKGVGALYVRRGVSLDRVLAGGHQERDLRPGTENVAGVAGLACAARLAVDSLERRSAVEQLRDMLWDLLSERVCDAFRNNPEEHCLPNTLNVSFPGVDSADLVIALDLEGVHVSGGAACASGAREPSHVARAMGLAPDLALSAIRISLGRTTTRAQILIAARVIARVVRTARSAARGESVGR